MTATWIAANALSATEHSRQLRRAVVASTVGTVIDAYDQDADALAVQDRGKFGVAGRTLADRAVEIDVGDQPTVTVAVHHIVDGDQIAVGLDDLAAHHNAGRRELLAGHLQLLSGVAVKAVGVDRRDIATEALRHLLPLGFAQSGPGRADRQAGHRRNVESPANDRLQLLETPALPECAAVLHRAEEGIVEALAGVAAPRRPA